MMKGHEKSSDKLSPKVNALLIIDVQEKIIRAIFKKDSITKNIKKLIDAYQILEENIFLSEQNPLKFATQKHVVEMNDKQIPIAAIDVSNGVVPVGSTWSSYFR